MRASPATRWRLRALLEGEEAGERHLPGPRIATGAHACLFPHRPQPRLARPVALDPRLREQAEEFERDRRTHEGRVAGLVERRRDLDHVGTDEVEVPEAAHELQRLAGREAADLGRAGAGRIGRIEGSRCRR